MDKDICENLHDKELRICCITIKYNKPDIFSELVAFGQQAERVGHKISYIFSENCKWLIEQLDDNLNSYYLGKSIDSKSIILDTLKFYSIDNNRIRKLFAELLPDIILFGNMHPANKLIATIARKSGCKEIWWWLHEPFRKNKKQFGLRRKYYYYLAESFQPRFLKIVDRVILSSEQARNVFSEKYSWFKGKVIKCPLIFLDYYEPFAISQPKYITFIGSTVPDKGIDIFFNLIEYSSINQPTLKFQLITSNKVERYINKLSSVAKGKLKIFSEKNISDLHLGRAVKNSLAVITPYRHTMQSGVVPVAFMHGIPVVSTDVGSMSEFVRPGETGVLMPADASLEDWLKEILKIKENREIMSNKCREYYENNHSPRNWLKVFPKLFNQFK